MVSGSTDSSTTRGSEPSSTTSLQTQGSSETAGSADDTGDTTRATTTTSSADTESSSSTRGMMEACTCPDPSWLCESFEGNFEGPPEPWAYNPANGPSAPTTMESMEVCGDAVLHTAVQIGESFSVAIASLAEGSIDSNSVSVHAWVYFETSCLPNNGGLLRALEFQLGSTGPAPAAFFFAGIWLRDGGGSLNLQNTGGGTTAIEFDLSRVVADQWLELQLDIDFSVNPPEVALLIDGSPVESGSGNLEVPMSVDFYSPSLTLGPYRGGPNFQANCSMSFDDVWIAPTP